MPRWTLYSLEGTLSFDDKAKLAEKITALYYSRGIPNFLVNVFFNEYKEGGFFSGGKAKHSVVFFHMDHAAWSFPDEDYRLKFMAEVDEIVKPILKDKCTKWEYNVYEHPNLNWRVNGMVPPVTKPDVWKQWIEKNEPVAY